MRIGKQREYEYPIRVLEYELYLVKTGQECRFKKVRTQDLKLAINILKREGKTNERD